MGLFTSLRGFPPMLVSGRAFFSAILILKYLSRLVVEGRSSRKQEVPDIEPGHYEGWVNTADRIGNLVGVKMTIKHVGPPYSNMTFSGIIAERPGVVASTCISLGRWIRWEPVACARHYAAEIGGSPFTRLEKCYHPLGTGNAVKKKLKEVYEGFSIGTPLEQARYGDQLTMCRVSGKWYLFLRKSPKGNRKLLQYPVLMERRVESGARDEQTSVEVESLSPGLPTAVSKPRAPLPMILDDKLPPPRQVGDRGSTLACSLTAEERRRAPLTNNARIPSSRVYVNSILIKGIELVNLRVSSGRTSSESELYGELSLAALSRRIPPHLLEFEYFSWGAPPAYDVLALPEMLLVPKGQPDDGCFVFAELTNATDQAQVSASLNEAGLAFGIKNFDLESITFCEMRKRRAVAQLRLGRQYMTLSPDLVIPLKDAPPAQSFDEIYREYELDEAGSLNQGVKRSRGRDDEVGRTGSRKKMKSS